MTVVKKTPYYPLADLSLITGITESDLRNWVNRKLYAPSRTDRVTGKPLFTFYDMLRLRVVNEIRGLASIHIPMAIEATQELQKYVPINADCTDTLKSNIAVATQSNPVLLLHYKYHDGKVGRAKPRVVMMDSLLAALKAPDGDAKWGKRGMILVPITPIINQVFEMVLDLSSEDIDMPQPIGGGAKPGNRRAHFL